MSPFEKSTYQNQVLGTEEFLFIAYTKMKQKIQRLQEIEQSKVRDKISLPLLKEKFEITHNILEALSLLIRSIDNEEVSNILAYIGIEISKGNIEKGTDAEVHYLKCIKVIDSFLSKPGDS
jgi:hypothetical protein